MSFLNLGFEQAGVGTGVAQAWTLVVVALGERVALFGGRDAEDFVAGWPTVEDYLFVLVPVLNTAEALFDTAQGPGEGFEDFHEGWATNIQYEFALSAVVDAFFSTPGPEGFAEGWGAYDFQLGAVVETPLEDFAGAWNGGDAASYSFVLGAMEEADFEGAGSPAEDFGPVYVDKQVLAVDPTGGGVAALRLTHGLSVGDVFTLRMGDNAQLPDGLLEGVPYHVLPGTLTALVFSRMPGGDPVELSDSGQGVFYVQGDAGVYWREAP